MALNYGEVATGPEFADGSSDTTIVDSGEWLDAAAIARLVDDTSADLLPEMAKIMVCELRKQAVEISAAVAPLDVSSLALASHVVKSSAATFGLNRVQTSASQLNAACKVQDLDQVRVLAADLLAQINPSILALQQMCGIEGEIDA